MAALVVRPGVAVVPLAVFALAVEDVDVGATATRVAEVGGLLWRFCVRDWLATLVVFFFAMTLSFSLVRSAGTIVQSKYV